MLDRALQLGFQCREVGFTQRPTEPAGTVVIVTEVTRLDVTLRQQAENDGIDGQRAELFDQIGHQRRMAIANRVQTADVRVETALGKQGEQVLKENAVAIGKQRVDRIGRWLPLPAREGPWCRQQAGETFKISTCGSPFEAAQRLDALSTPYL